MKERVHFVPEVSLQFEKRNSRGPLTCLGHVKFLGIGHTGVLHWCSSSRSSTVSLASVFRRHGRSERTEEV